MDCQPAHSRFTPMLKLKSAPGAHGLPENAFQALADALRSVPRLQRHYFPEGLNRLDRDDSEAEALLEAIQFIKRKTEETPTTKDWPKEQWYKHIMRRVQNAILEYTKYVYLPVVVPRPLRFSLKKYADALKLINRYVRAAKDVAHSDLYYAVFKANCNLLVRCTSCTLGYEECPLRRVSYKTRKELHAILKGDRESLEFYAQWYRKTLGEWIELLEMLRTYSVSYDLPEIPIIPDLESSADVGRFHNRLVTLHPDLYEIYCSSLEDIDLGRLEETLVIPTPRGWSNKSIKDQFGLTTEQYREMLIRGDSVLNEFRANAGLPRIRRDFQEESPS